MGCFGVFLLFSVFISLISAISGGTQTFIVRVQNELKPFAFSSVDHWYKSTLQTLTTASHGGEDIDLLYTYKTVFHGFSAKLTDQQANELEKRRGVLAVIPDRLRQVQTTRSPQFLGISESNPTGLLAESDSGSNVVIAVIDTGIWPERRSFDDHGLGPVPSHWKGECEEGERFPKILCNRKIIGARFFTIGYDASKTLNITALIRSARDSSGHGTHTASIAAGRRVGNASLLGFASGVAVGVAPKARIAVYKACWARGCLDSDVLAAFDRAVEDGVDVVSISVAGIHERFDLDPVAIGSFGAMERGILVSASAGNQGEGTVANLAPWITTVGASTIDRSFPADLVLEDGSVITGTSLYSGKPFPEKTFLPLVYAVPGEGFSGGFCDPYSLDRNRVGGKIVMCDNAIGPRVAKGEAVKQSGGAGVIIANVKAGDQGSIADAHLIPGLTISQPDREKVVSYINATKNPRATILFRGTQFGAKPAPMLAAFSSRGPITRSLNILKPDVVAPGVNILAAWPDGVAPTEQSSDGRDTEFNIVSGTSMSCPHVSGVAALLKGAHPDWSPAMIRSALMTTAYTRDHNGKPLLDEINLIPADAWGFGAGHVDPERAADPGLVYDLTADDYVNFLCASNYTLGQIRLITRRSVKCTRKQNKPWDLNYPAIAIAFDVSRPSHLEVVVKRTVTHVSKGGSSYTVTVTQPKDATITVDPVKMEFRNKGEKQSFKVRIVAKKVEVPTLNMESEFGKLTWTDNNKHTVTLPVVVMWQNQYN